MQCILDKYLETAFCDKSFEVFEKLNDNGGFGLEIAYDWAGTSEQEGPVNLGYVYEGGNMKDQYDPVCCYRNPDNKFDYNFTCCWKPTSTQKPNLWSGQKDGNMADTYPIRPLGAKTTINKFLCENKGALPKNGLELASLFSHELLHSRIMARMTDLCLGVVPGCDEHSFTTFQSTGPVWKKLLELYETDPEIRNPHQLMEKVFKDDLIRVLMDMNGDIDFRDSNKERYLYFVLGNIASDELLVSEGFVSDQQNWTD